METLRLALLVLHLLGFAALFGGLFVQLRDTDRKVNRAMRDGAGAALVAGVLLVAVLEASDETVDQVKIGVKLLIGLLVLVLVMANRRKARIPDAVYYLALVLTVANVGVAVFWASSHT